MPLNYHQNSQSGEMWKYWKDIPCTGLKAPRHMLNSSPYVNDQMYESQELTQKEIGVDTARYLINVDNRWGEIYTEEDGSWGDCLELSRGKGTQRVLDAIIVTVYMPESEDFQSMRQRVNCFFQDVQRLKSPEDQSQKMKM